MLDAVKYAADDLDHLRFHPRALDTAATCPYRAPSRIYDDLAILDDLAGEWQATGRLVGRWIGAADRAGLRWAPDISDTAKSQYRSDYEITLGDGTKALLGPHLRRGAGTGPQGHFRVYLHIDDHERVVTVGYVGPHLCDATNP